MLTIRFSHSLQARSPSRMAARPAVRSRRILGLGLIFAQNKFALRSLMPPPTYRVPWSSSCPCACWMLTWYSRCTGFRARAQENSAARLGQGTTSPLRSRSPGLYSPSKAPTFDVGTAHRFGPGRGDTAASVGVISPLSPDSRLFSDRREAHPRSTEEILAE